MAYTWPVTVAEAKSHLGTTASVDDTELGGFVDAATSIVEYLCGPITSTSYTESYNGGECTIALRRAPILTVTSVVEYQGNNAVTLTEATDPSGATSGLNYTLDKKTGTLTRVSGPGWAYPFYVGTRNIVITYTAGFAAVPPNVRLAALELVRVNWTETQNGRRTGRGSDSDGTYLMGYFVPNRVREMLTPNERIPGIA